MILLFLALSFLVNLPGILLLLLTPSCPSNTTLTHSLTYSLTSLDVAIPNPFIPKQWLPGEISPLEPRQKTAKVTKSGELLHVYACVYYACVYVGRYLGWCMLVYVRVYTVQYFMHACLATV